MPDALQFQTLLDLLYALGIGLFVGLEREHSDATDEPDPVEDAPSLMGVRTFGLLGLLGWLCGFGGKVWPWLPPVGFVLVGGLVLAQYMRGKGRGTTTEAAAMLTFAMGLVVNVDRAVAVGAALVTVLLLLAKPWMREIIPKIRRVELTSTLQLLILLAIVLPLLPAEPLDPWQALPPRKLGLFVILIAGLSYIGYILSRILGESRGAGLTGFIGGLASSTATTVAMARMGRDSDMVVPAQLGVFIANSVMFARVLIITAVISRDVARELLFSVGAMGLVTLSGAVWAWRRLATEQRGKSVTEKANLKNPFALLPALKWGAVMAGVLLVAVLAEKYFGENGLYAAALASGLADVDAITLAVTERAASSELALAIAANAITIAVMSNTVVKAGLAYFGGGRTFGTPILVVFALTLAAGGITLAVF